MTDCFQTKKLSPSRKSDPKRTRMGFEFDHIKEEGKKEKKRVTTFFLISLIGDCRLKMVGGYKAIGND